MNEFERQKQNCFICINAVYSTLKVYIVTGDKSFKYAFIKRTIPVFKLQCYLKDSAFRLGEIVPAHTLIVTQSCII